MIKDIRFWILLFFIIRMYGITLPPLEIAHSWRQTDGLMIARNFLEVDSNIFYPRVDVGGEKSGIVGCEFPLLNYCIYLISLLFGYNDWYGRLVVLILSSFGTFFFYKSIRKIFNERIAFNAAILLLVSFWFSYSRKTIPDVFAASLCLISLFYSLQYLDTGKIKYILIFFVMGLFGCLSKILGASILTVLLIPILNRNISFSRKIVLSAVSTIILLLVTAWYFWWVPHLNDKYGFGDHFSMGYPYSYAIPDIINNLSGVSERIFITPLKNTGLIAFVVAIGLVIWKKAWISLLVFSLPFVAYLILIAKTGSSMIGDHYYILTMIPCYAFILAYGLDVLKKEKVIAIFVIAIAIEGIGDQYTDFRVKPRFLRLTELERIFKNVSKSGDLIATNGEFQNPTIMYFTHRHGWALQNAQLADTIFLSEIQRKGCKYVLIAKELWGDLDLRYPIIYESKYFKIYKLEKRFPNRFGLDLVTE
jgi:hypothetical protein